MDETLPQPNTVLTQPKPKRRGIGAALGGVGVLLAKLAGSAKLLLPFLKTGGSMLLMIWVYSMTWGWSYALGFVVLIFVHECGHLLVARRFGLKVGAPVFIPFMGAFIALKEAPKDAWIEACVGIGGPILGSIGAAACIGLYYLTGNLMFVALAYSGFFLNLFNLIPITPLDGGRVAAAISPWLWLVGVVALGLLLWFGLLHFNFVLAIILILFAVRVIGLFRKGAVKSASYFMVSPTRRWSMAVVYVGLIAALVAGMRLTHLEPARSQPQQFSRVGRPYPGIKGARSGWFVD